MEITSAPITEIVTLDKSSPLIAASASLVREAGKTLGASFTDDPSMIYAVGDKASLQKRTRLVQTICTDMVRYALMSKSCYLDLALINNPATNTYSKVAGVAIWIKPGCHISTWEMIQAGCWRWPFRMGLDVIYRSMKYTDIVEKHHTENMPEEHWYLYMLGVKPGEQSKGVGGELIKHAVARTPYPQTYYLESFNKANLVFYERHGFTVIDTAQALLGKEKGEGKKELPFWMLKRDF